MGSSTRKDSPGCAERGHSRCDAASVVLLAFAMRSLPVGTAYAVWTGIGAVGTVVLGIALFGGPATAARLACIGLILAGIVGLKLVA